MKRILASALAAFALAFASVAAAPLAAAQDAQRQTRFETPIEIVNEKVFVPVTVNGRAYQAVYDSGASRTYLSRRAAEELGLDLTHGAATAGFGGRADVSHADNVTLNVSTATMRFSQMRVVDLTELVARSGRRYDMILGTDAMTGYVMEIDPVALRMRWTAREIFIPPREARAVPVRRWSGHLHTPVTVNGERIQAVIDIGSSAPLIASRQFAQRAGINLDATAGHYSTGIGGGVESRVGTAAQASVGGATFTDMPIAIFPRTLPGDVELNLGFPILRRFRFFMDFERNQVWLAPIPGAASAPFPRNHVGLTIARETPEALRVLFVADTSPAHRAGLAADDTISAIDGVAVADWPAETPITEWMQGAEGEERQLTLADGRNVSLRLARYF